MTKLTQSLELASLSSVALVFAAFACDSGTNSDGTTGMAGARASAGTASSSAGALGSAAGSTSSAGRSNGAAGGTGGPGPHAGGTGGVVGASGSSAGGLPSSAGTVGSAGSGGGAGAIAAVPLPPLVTSAPGAYWKTDGTLTDSTAAATVTVNDTMAAQKWEGMGAAFNELGWKYLATPEMQSKAITWLFSASEGANFAWGRVPIGASDYAESRYTLDDVAVADPKPDGTESNRPAQGKFSLDRDKLKLIPYIKAAQAVKKDLRFWASPWTPPVWMKTGYKKNNGADSSQTAVKPSYYDGGTMKGDAATLSAYATYYSDFVRGYEAQGIDIEIVSPQNEPGYDQNYPSCLWDKATYSAFIGNHLGPAMQSLGVKVMLGTLSNANTDFDIAAAAAADATAKKFLAVVGAQWNTLDAGKLNALNSGLPFWATEHKCGNYPFCKKSGDCASEMGIYTSSQAPNDQAYAVESWGYIRDAISKVKVSAYNAWNMVLDKNGLGIDTSREWKQDALLVADGGTVTQTPAYFVFRHVSQYVTPGATVVGTTGGDALAFKNPDGSLVAVMFNSGSANAKYVLAIGGKKFQFAMPGNGWATVKYKP